MFQVSSDGSSSVTVTGTPGPTPFIGFLQLSGQTLAPLDSVSWTVQPKQGRASKPVAARYAYAALQRRGWIGETSVTVPVFGLYAGVENQVSVEVETTNGSRQGLTVRITTDPYEDPEGVYDHPAVLQARPAGSTLGFDFIALKSMRASVVVVDTDGEVRWVGTSTPSAATIFTGNGFVVGSPTSTQVARLELDGEVAGAQVDDPSLVEFTHNIDPGKVGLLAEFDAEGEVDATGPRSTRPARCSPGGSSALSWGRTWPKPATTPHSSSVPARTGSTSMPPLTTRGTTVSSSPAGRTS